MVKLGDEVGVVPLRTAVEELLNKSDERPLEVGNTVKDEV